MALVIALLMAPTSASAKRCAQGGRGDGPVISVTGQGSVYDSIIAADPPPIEG